MGEFLGIVVADRYELTGVLGQGGQGVIYRARDRTAGRDVAVKMLSDSVADDPVYAARLAREQEALVALAGTSAVAVYDLCEAPNGSLCLVMELLEGTDLEKHLSELEAREERLALPRLSAIIEPIVDTLERAHDAGIIHRDLKPGNIFLVKDGEGVRLFDFGLSRSKKAVRLTQAGTVMGSPSYIAPEVWKGDSDALDARVDVYSLGVILFRALSGHLPFAGATLKESFELASRAQRPSLRALRPDLSPKVDAWVAQALAIEPDRRYQTVHGLWNGLLKALQYQPPPRTMRPVADSLVGAWKAATGAFRRLVDRATAATPPSRPATAPPESLSPPAEEVAAVDDGWIELTDADEISVRSPVAAVAPPKALPKKPSATPHRRSAPPPRRRKVEGASTRSAGEEKKPAPAAKKDAPDPSHHDHTDDGGDRPSFRSTAGEVRAYLDSVAPPDQSKPAAEPNVEKRSKGKKRGNRADRKQKKQKQHGPKKAKDASGGKVKTSASSDDKQSGTAPASRRK
jgi:serine/threonine protein kinase